MITTNENKLLEAANQLLEKSSNELDEFIVARLRAARMRALDAKRSPYYFSRTAIAGAVSGVLVLTVAGLLWTYTPAPVSVPAPVAAPVSVPVLNNKMMVADLDLLATPDSHDFYVELGFYAWLDTKRKRGTS